MVTINPVLSKLATYPAEALYAKRRELKARGLEVFDFSVGDPIEKTADVIRTAFKASIPEVSQYPSVAGEAAFRSACADWFSRRFDCELDPQHEIIPSSGSKESIFHLPLTFIDRDGPRRRVIYGTPAYPVYERGTLFAGGEPHPIELRPENGYRLEPWKLPPDLIAKTSIIWVNYPHNPTGAVVDDSYLKKLGEFCVEHDILLCCDECYVDLYLDSPLPGSILKFHRNGVLAFHSLSKRSGITGYRSGFIAGDRELIATLRGSRANFGVASTHMVQQAAIAAWRDEAHAEERREIFRAKRDAFCAFFDQVGLEYLDCAATLYLWIAVPAGHTAQSYAEALANIGLLVSPAGMFGADQPYFRIALVPPLAQCERAIDTWRNAFEELLSVEEQP